jgi:hypothetical protein
MSHKDHLLEYSGKGRRVVVGIFHRMPIGDLEFILDSYSRIDLPDTISEFCQCDFVTRVNGTLRRWLDQDTSLLSAVAEHKRTRYQWVSDNIAFLWYGDNLLGW